MKKKVSKSKRDSLSSNDKPRLSAKKGRVLIVGHEEPVRNIVSSMLISGGHECRVVGGGLEALALLEAGEKCDVILTDFVNDQFGGIGILERTRERFPDVQIILMTSMRRISYAFVGVREGAYDYLLLPFEHEQLLFLIGRAMEYRGLKLQNRDYEKRLGLLATSKSQKPARILMQDDEESIREIVCAMLTFSRYECRRVESPQGALDILTSGEQFDLVLCGLIETLEADFFKQVSNRFPDIPGVVLSACHGFQLFRPALRDGAYDYLNKPFERQQLELKVLRGLEYRRLRLQNRAYARLAM
jgi:DNA-binding NtrC family response regulator